MAGNRIGQEFVGANGEGFRLTDFLGNGAFGEVYRAIGSTSGTVVAVKLLPSGDLSDPMRKAAFENEARLAMTVQHPNVVRVLHASIEASGDTGPHIIMEYVGGGTLAGVLKNHAQAGSLIPLPRAREMMLDIAQGARAINEQLIHRDIKPDNILIQDGRLKISDFGISKVVSESTRTHTFKGGQHPAFMAPEGWEGHTNSHKIDVYSVGLVFYQILALRDPISESVTDHGNLVAWREAHLFGHVPDVRSVRSDVPLTIAQLVARMVSKQPAPRPDWDEVISIVSQSEDAMGSVDDDMNRVVEIAVKRSQELESERLKKLEEEDRRGLQLQLYKYSCQMLAQLLESIVDEFSSSFQLGGVRKQGIARGGLSFSFPTGKKLMFEFFDPPSSPIPYGNSLLIGGGFIHVVDGVGGNLLLKKEEDADLYGVWEGCWVKPSALANPRSIVGKWGVTPSTQVPFGFSQPKDLYGQIVYAIGVTHVIDFELQRDIRQFMLYFLEQAVS